MLLDCFKISRKEIMNLIDYHWDKIGWKGFEEMCMYLAECVMNDRRFELYGRPGEDQDGIDIISKNERGEEQICIQCKRYEKMKLSTLKSIIRRFEESPLLKTTNSFIIATRASLNNRNIVLHINSEKERLKKQYKIHFDTWDINYIEKELANHFTLTSKYFGFSIAQTLWSGLGGLIPSYQPFKGYIPRSVVPYLQEKDTSLQEWIWGKKRSLGLSELFTRNIFESKKCCLLADAYQGKTTTLEQVAYELYTHDLKIKPVFVRLKEHSHRSLIDTLDIAHVWWRSVPIKELVIFVDGLDEVDTGRFQDAVKNINELSTQFPSLSIIFSCRKLFFHHNEVQEVIKGFSIYELFPLQGFQIDEYLTEHLHGLKDKFLNHIEKYELNHFLNNPFYLRSLVDIFIQDRSRLPKSKAETVFYFIEESFNMQAFRELAGGLILKRKKEAYYTILKKAAFAMQLRGQNVLTDEEVQVLFHNNQEIELLRLGSVLTFSHEKWSFQNAIFQEFLCAQVLDKLSFDYIEQLTCVGQCVKKVKTKWIQSLIALLSILKKNDDRKKLILEMLRRDNLELVTLCDSQLLPVNDRLTILHQLLKQYEERGMRPIVVREDSIGRFFKGSEDAIRILLGVLGVETHLKLKQIVWRILEYIDLPVKFTNEVLEIAQKEINQSADSKYAISILYTCLNNRIESKRFVEFLTIQHHLNSQLRYRDKVYDLILQHDLGDEFYDYAIEGAQIAFSTPCDNYVGSEFSLEEILLSAKSLKNIRKLLTEISSNQQMFLRHHRFVGTDTFVSRLALVCKAIHEENPLIILDIIKFTINLNKSYRSEDFKEFDSFFTSSGSNSFAVRYWIHCGDKNSLSDIGRLLTKEAFDFLFAYYEANYISSEALLRLVNSIYYEGSREVMLEFNSLYVAATGEDDLYQKSLEQHNSRIEHEVKKRENDRRYIKSKRVFKEGVNNYFIAYGNKTMPEDEILIDFDIARAARRTADSYFIANFILYQVRNGRSVTLYNCLKEIDNREYFDQFRMVEIYNYPGIEHSDNTLLKNILQKLYDNKVVKADFKNALKQDDEFISVSRKEGLLINVFEKFKFPTNSKILIDMLCMDRTGINNFKTPGYSINRKPSLSELILEQLSPEMQSLAGDTVIARLKEGILVKEVLENHVALCRRLYLTEAKDIILDILLAKQIVYYNIFDVVEIFLELGGELERLLPVLGHFEEFNNNSYYALILKLKEEFPEAVIISLLKAIYTESLNSERHIYYVQILIELGNVDGFLYIIKQLETNKFLLWNDHINFSMEKIDTLFALNELKPHLNLLLEKDPQKGYQMNAKIVVSNFLYSLAQKSENDLLCVDRFLKEAEEHYLTEFSDMSMIRLYRERILENFRDSNPGNNSFSEMMAILKEVEYCFA